MDETKKYPAGRFYKPEKYDETAAVEQIGYLKEFPELLVSEIGGLDRSGLSQKTAPGVWTIAQVVNHIADSHMNAFTRVKLTLTESNPVVKPYNEDLWANTRDGSSLDIRPSLSIIEGVHARFALFFSSLSKEEFGRAYFHPEYQTTYPLYHVLALYAWHGRHHLGFISDRIHNT